MRHKSEDSELNEAVNMHGKIVTYNVLCIVLSVLVLYVCPHEIDEPLIGIYPSGRFFLLFKDLHDVSSINFSSFLISTNGQSVVIIQNGTFCKRTSNWWYHKSSNMNFMPKQVICFEILIKHKEYGDVTMLKEYKVPLWPGIAPDRTCQKSETTVQERKVCADELIFEDNFDLLTKSIWHSEFQIPLDADDADFARYDTAPPYGHTQHGNFYYRPIVADQVLNYDESEIRTGLIEYDTECTGTIDPERECKRQANFFRILPPIVSARISTKDTFSFRYGKIEVRAKLPEGDWLFPLITLEPRTPKYGVFGHASGQMRVAFIRSNKQLRTKEGKAIDGSYLFGGVVLNTGDRGRESWLRSVKGPEHWGNQFHNYTLIWTSTSISLGYDGKTYATLTGGFIPGLLTPMAPFDTEFFISIGLSAGGISDFPDGSVSGTYDKPWNNTDPKGELKFYNARHKWHPTWKDENNNLLIDHVKVWAL